MKTLLCPNAAHDISPVQVGQKMHEEREWRGLNLSSFWGGVPGARTRYKPLPLFT